MPARVTAAENETFEWRPRTRVLRDELRTLVKFLDRSGHTARIRHVRTDPDLWLSSAQLRPATSRRIRLRRKPRYDVTVHFSDASNGRCVLVDEYGKEHHFVVMAT